MTNVTDYFKTRNIAIAITLVILILGSIIYFSTNIAEQNNKMMYEKISIDINTTINAVINNSSNTNVTRVDIVIENKNVKTALV